VNPSVALIKRVEFPGFGLNESSGAPGSNVSLKAVDINNVVKPGDTNSELAVLVIEGISTGDAALNIEVKELDDDHGNPIFADIKPGRVVVLLSPLPLPAQREPRDLDGDGLFEDLNGNGRLDFADVVLFFKHKDFIEVNWGASLTDFNGNGRLDFDDIVKLFKRV
jgi:PKD repeat protein